MTNVPEQRVGTQPRLPLVERNKMTIRRLWSSWVGDAGIALLLFFLPFLFFWRFVTPHLADRVTFARGDFVGQYYPLRFFVADQLGQGRFPLWNPYIYGGQPALADIQSAALYLPNLIQAWFLGGDRFTVLSLEIQVILHFSLAALFTFLFVRRLTGSRFAAVVSSVIYTYSGYMTSFPIRQMTMLGVGVWLPLILFFVDLGICRLTGVHGQGVARRQNSWLVPIVLAGMTFGVSITGGHPQTSLYVAYLCAAYILYRLWPFRSTEPWPHNLKHDMRLVLPFALVPLIGVGLAAVQLLPTLEFIRYSTRAELNYTTVSWGLPIHELVSLIYPGYSGNSPQYLGILPMILIGAGLFLPRRWKDQGFWAVAAIVSLLLSLGGNTFLFSFFYNVVPGFSNVRDQERVVFLFAFSLAVLAGYGAQALASRVEARATQESKLLRGVSRFSIVMLALTALFLYGWAQGQRNGGGDIFVGVLRHHTFTLLLLGGIIVWLVARPRTPATRFLWKSAGIGLILLNLFTINWEFHIHDIPQGGYFPETGTVRFLREQANVHPQSFRINSAGLLPGGSSAGAVYGFRDLTGNSPLHLDAFQEFNTEMGEWRKWQLLNVLYVLDKRELDGAGLRRVHEEDELKVYEVTDPFPHAWVVHDVQAVDDDEEAYALLNMDDFDLRRSAVVSDVPHFALRATEGATAQVIESAPKRFVIQADLPAPGLLILSEIYYPGWKATVDGQPAPLLRTDVVLRGVPLAAGSHRVEIHYAPSSFRLGAAISALTLLACIAGLVLPCFAKNAVVYSKSAFTG